MSITFEDFKTLYRKTVEKTRTEFPLDPIPEIGASEVFSKDPVDLYTRCNISDKESIEINATVDADGDGFAFDIVPKSYFNCDGVDSRIFFHMNVRLKDKACIFSQRIHGWEQKKISIAGDTVGEGTRSDSNKEVGGGSIGDDTREGDISLSEEEDSVSDGDDDSQDGGGSDSEEGGGDNARVA